MEAAKEATNGIARDMGDVLIYALYPTTGLRYLKWKYGLEKPPADTKGKTLEDVKREDDLIAKVKSGKLNAVPVQSNGVRNFKVYVGDEVYNIGVEAANGAECASPAASPAPAAAQSAPAAVSNKAPEPAKPAEKETVPAPVSESVAGTPVTAPMPGMILDYEVKVGDVVNADDAVVMLEAMKMANVITAPVSGKILAINYKSGDRVATGAVLAVIG
jgi:biotin carboxyl carrier protein